MSLGLSELMCLFEFGKGYLTAKQVTHCSYVLILVFCPKDYCFHPCLSIFSLIHLSASINLFNWVTLIRVQEDRKMQYIFWRYVSSCDLSEPNMGRIRTIFWESIKLQKRPLFWCVTWWIIANCVDLCQITRNHASCVTHPNPIENGFSQALYCMLINPVCPKNEHCLSLMA